MMIKYSKKIREEFDLIINISQIKIISKKIIIIIISV